MPFALVAPLSGWVIGCVVFLAALSEFAGVLAQANGSSRRYDGPMGKSDRAFVFGVLGLWIGIAGSLPDWMVWVVWMICILLSITIINRIRHGLAERASNQSV